MIGVASTYWHLAGWENLHVKLTSRFLLLVP